MKRKSDFKNGVPWQAKTSPSGRKIRDDERLFSRFSINRKTGCLEHIGAPNSRGYVSSMLGGQRIGAHRAAYRHFYGDIPSGMVVMHKCDNRLCINPVHLALGTYKENSMDMVRKGRVSRGEHKPNSRLTRNGVIRIRHISKTQGLPQSKIAEMFGVSRRTIGKVLSGETWRHVK